MAALYEKIILQHYRQPLHRGTMKSPSKILRGANYFCGDTLTFFLKLDAHGVIVAVSWIGEGCTISQATASIFSDMIKGKKLATIQKMKSATVLKKLNLKLSPMRVKCALLPLYVIKEEDVSHA